MLDLLFAYLFGSFPTAWLVGRFLGIKDIRNFGSGNVGSTNVFRTGNKKMALITFLIDCLKGILAMLLLSDPYVGPMVILGHIFPIWLGFRGGKGVATAFGVYLIINPLFALISLLIWGISLYWFRISSLSSIISVVGGWLLGIVFLPAQSIYITGLITTIIVIAHYSNIKRILEGTEKGINN